MLAVRCIDGFDWHAWRETSSEEIVEATCHAMILLARLLVRAYYEGGQEVDGEKGRGNRFCRRILIKTTCYWYESLVTIVHRQVNDKYAPQSLGRTRLNFTVLSILKLYVDSLDIFMTIRSER